MEWNGGNIFRVCVVPLVDVDVVIVVVVVVLESKRKESISVFF